MTRSCVFLILILGVLGVRGEGEVTNSVVTDGSNSQPPLVMSMTALQSSDSLGNGIIPGDSRGVMLAVQDTLVVPEPYNLEIPVPRSGETRGATLPVQDTLAVPEPYNLEIPVPDASGEPVNDAASDSDALKALGEGTQPGGPKIALSEQKLIRRKRTFSKHKGCMICGMMPQIIMMKHPMYPPQQPCYSCQQQPTYHPPPPPPPPPPQQYCDPCQRQQYQPPPPPPQHYNPCGGGGCGGPPMGGSWSQSQSSAQSSSHSGSWGKKK